MAQERTLPTNRPATVVTPLILIEGGELARTWLVDSITVRKEVNRVPWAKVVILDGSAAGGAFTASNAPLFVPGKTIEVRCGYQNETFPLFKGLIINHAVKLRGNGSSMLVLECRDLTVKMTVGRRSRYFANLKDSEVISRIADSYSGITASVDDTKVSHRELVQYRCSDWDFILARAEANGRILLADDATLAVKPPDLGQSPALSLQFGATMLEFDGEIDARHQLKKITSRSWDYTEQSILQTEGADPVGQLHGNLTAAELADVLGLEDFVQDHSGRKEEGELQAWSDALALRRRLARVRGRVRCKGVHTVKPGMIVELGGIGDRFNGKAFVGGIQHFIAAGDWSLDIQFGMEPQWFTERTEISDQPAAGLLAAPRGLQIGVVTQIDSDPEGEHRIKVRLPIISESEEGIWARLATLDAGSERGSFFLPEVGDEVIVGFINDDPRDAVVLGMLHSSALPAPLTAEANNPQKGFVTRSKMKLIFDDEKKKCTVETPAGKSIVLDEDGDAVTLSDEHGNKLVMDSSGIVIESQGNIELKALKDLQLGGLNTALQAQASLTVEGSASTELKAGGSMTVKGAVVQIN